MRILGPDPDGGSDGIQSGSGSGRVLNADQCGSGDSGVMATGSGQLTKDPDFTVCRKSPFYCVHRFQYCFLQIRISVICSRQRPGTNEVGSDCQGAHPDLVEGQPDPVPRCYGAGPGTGALTHGAKVVGKRSRSR